MYPAPPYATQQFVGPQFMPQMPQSPHYGQAAWPTQPPMPPQPPAGQMPAQGSQLEQQWNAWAEKHGVDLDAQFNGDIGKMLDAMYEAAQAGFEAQDAAKAAIPQPAPAKPPSADVNWREWEQWLEPNERGELVPKRDAPYQVPYAAVKQANDVLRKVQAFRYDPEGFLKENVGSFVEERAAAIAEERLKAFQQEQARERNLESFIQRNGEWLFNNGDQKQGLTEAGNKFLESVQRSEELGVSPEHVLDDALQRWQGTFLRDALQQAQTARLQQQQPQQTFTQPGGEQPQFDQQPGQPRNPDGTFAPVQQQQPQPQPQSVQDQIAQYGGNNGQHNRLNGQLPYPGAMPQGGQMQYQPTQNGYGAWNGTPGATAQPTPPQAFGQQQAAPFVEQAAQPQQNTFLQEHNIPAAAMEPTQRSHADAGGVIGTPANDQHIPDMDDIIEESIRTNGLT